MEQEANAVPIGRDDSTDASPATDGGGPLLDEWADVLADDDLYLGLSPEAFEAERRRNMWCLGASSAQLRRTTPEALADWVRRLVEDRRAKVGRRYSGRRAVFYLWFDEQAGQLRFNVMADHGGPLPFACAVRTVAAPEPIVRAFAESPHVDGIPWSELQDVTDAPADADRDSGDTAHTLVLDVFVAVL